eukprot:m.49631 g.49631  ORF g.49631 m.49631 type:complete len:56 (+) comp7139_c0_seq1:58-225(+)
MRQLTYTFASDAVSHVDLHASHEQHTHHGCIVQSVTVTCCGVPCMASYRHRCSHP